MLKFSIEFKELMMADPPNGPTLADIVGPTPPPNPTPQPRHPSIVRRFATHLGLVYLVDLIRNGFDFDIEFDDVGSLF